MPQGSCKAGCEKGFSVNKGWKFCCQRCFSNKAASNDGGFGVRDRWCCVSEQLTECDESDAGRKGAAEFEVRVDVSLLHHCFPLTNKYHRFCTLHQGN